MKCVPFGANVFSRVSIVLNAVLNFAGYWRCFELWVYGFVNCVTLM